MCQAYLSKLEWRWRSWLGPHEVQTSSPTDDTGKEENLSALKSIFESARADGSAAVAVLLPNTDVLEQQRSQFDPFDAFCRDHNLPCLNLLDPFIAKRVDARALRLNPLDNHPNEAYHALVAEVLADCLAPLIGARRNSS